MKQSKIEAAPKRKRLTATQRRERDFWLGCAERADAQARGAWKGLTVFLCCEAGHAGRPDLRAKVEYLFDVQNTSDPAAFVRWDTRSDVEWEECFNPIYDRPSNRVLAACFLAAMAELGE